MLDAFTSFMCVESWGRIGYARALIEVWASKELKEEFIMFVHIVDDNGDTTGYTKERIRVEYEWKPPLCLECHVFGHYAEMCPKRVTQPVTKTNDANNDGFMAVNNRKKKGKALAHTKPSEGLKMNKQKVKVVWQKVTQPVDKVDKEGTNVVKLKNHFDALRDQDDLLQDREVGETSGINNEAKVAEPDPNMSSDNEVEEMVIEPDPRVTKLKGASTPS
ncbi:trichome birefringence-like protein 3 [Tanacetum coccineum]